MSEIFTTSEKRVISAMFRLNRWATANEIAKWADNMSWNTAIEVLRGLIEKRVVEFHNIKGRDCWKIINLS